MARSPQSMVQRSTSAQCHGEVTSFHDSRAGAPQAFSDLGQGAGYAAAATDPSEPAAEERSECSLASSLL